MARVDRAKEAKINKIWDSVEKGLGIECRVIDGIKTAEYKLKGDADEAKYVVKILVPASRVDEGERALQALADRINRPDACECAGKDRVSEPDPAADAAD